MISKIEIHQPENLNTHSKRPPGRAEAKKPVCAVLLAGGKSSRMGKNKVLLNLCGKTLLDIQLEKLCALDVNEILVSGDPELLKPHITGLNPQKPVRVIADIIPDKGPLGGFHACFGSTTCPSAIVLSVDVPLIRTETLQNLLDFYRNNNYDAAVLTTASFMEPLIAVYNTKTVPLLEKLIRGDRLSVKGFLNHLHIGHLQFEGNLDELANCNTRLDFEKIQSVRLPCI
ncbi:MAG: molybdenum cofactor guanylyltransferase [Lachnospiraceae bacterium]|nr:molybdenum cofactor guanylyltransferase [Lachnospiraceae bacterium]